MNIKVYVYITIALSLIAAAIFFSNRFAKPTKEVATPTVNPLESTNKEFPRIEAIVKNLEVPWALAFLPDGKLLVTERMGRVRVIDQGKLQEKPVAILNQVRQISEGGLLGIAVDPDFNLNNFVYLYYTYSGNNSKTLNRVSRFKLEDNKLTSERVIVEGIPGAPNHNGGRIKFGPDKNLYIGTGDAQDPSQAQDKLSLAGKILMVIKGKYFEQVYSLGHRNVQGLSWDNQGRLWATEHGNQATDELNFIESGKNYGWPTIQGDQTKEGMETPKLNSGNTTWAPAGATFHNGSIFFGGLRSQTLYEVKLDTLELKEHFKGSFGRIREVILGPDNLLYITTSNRDGRGVPKNEDDQILRIDPSKL